MEKCLPMTFTHFGTPTIRLKISGNHLRHWNVFVRSSSVLSYFQNSYFARQVNTLITCPVENLCDKNNPISSYDTNYIKVFFCDDFNINVRLNLKSYVIS